MSLRDTANADLRDILNSDDTGGVLCIITAPDESFEEFRVFHNDIQQSVDPGTGEVVTGRQSSIAVLTNELIDGGFEGIRGVADAESRPWLVTITDVVGRSDTFKVCESFPDNSIGLTVLLLEFYET